MTVPINNMTDTWNNAGTTFRSILMNVTNTASATPSYLMDLQVGSSSMFSVDKAGNTKVAVNAASGGSPSSLSLDILNARGGFYGPQASQINMAAQGKYIWAVNDGSQFQRGMAFADDVALSWETHASSTIGNAVAPDLSLYRDTAVGVLAHGSGSTPQGLRVYNTTDQTGTNTAPTAYERGVFDWVTTANTLTIGTQAGGTGTSRQTSLVQVSGISAWATFGVINFTGCFGGIAFYTGAASGVSVSINPTNSGGGVSLTDGMSLLWLNHANLGVNFSGISTAASGVIRFGVAADATGWMNWGGEARLDADFSATSNTTLANVTGTSNNLSVSLSAGRKYIFDICLEMVTGASAGGIKIGIGGTATVTNLIADGWCLDGTTNIAVTRVSASPGTLVANTNAGTAPVARFMGTFECNAAGTFTVQFAQNASSGTASTVKRGSYMNVNDAL